MKATWSGTISCGVMGIPVKMYSAVQDSQSRFNKIHNCGSRIREPSYCPACERFVESSEIKKGYQVGKDEYVVFEDYELEALKLKSNSSIEIIEFISPDAISDPRVFGKPYFLAPNWESSKKRFLGLKEFTLFARTLAETGFWALGKVVQRDREHIVLIRPFGNNILLMHQLRYQTELRDTSEIKTDVVEVSEKELELGKMLAEALKGNGDLSKYQDRYEEALSELIEKKLSGETIKAEALPTREEGDLAEQLLKSLELVKK